MQSSIPALFESKMFRMISIGIALLLVAVCIFRAGMSIGYRKAAFTYQQGDNYYRAFGRHVPRPYGIPMHDEVMDTHGAVGKIISVDAASIVVSSPDGIERVISMSTTTRIKYLDDTVPATSLHVDDFVVIFGVPDKSSRVDAKLIRILPPPPETSTTSTSHRSSL